MPRGRDRATARPSYGGAHRAHESVCRRQEASPSVVGVSGDGAAPVLRVMEQADVGLVVELQEPASVRALAAVFPQDRYPFPREEVTARWHLEVADPLVDCFTVLHDGEVAGFVATRHDELLHFGVAIEHWGSGLAARAHEAVLEHLRAQGHAHTWLRVFTANGRARRFYEKHNWEPTGHRSLSTFAPHPELVRYQRTLG